MPDSTTPEILPPGTRYTCGVETFELLEPSTRRPDGKYPVTRRLYLSNGYEDPGCIDDERAGLDLREGVTLPVSAKADPYAEHRKRIGDDR